MYIYIYTYTYICIYAYIYIYTYTWRTLHYWFRAPWLARSRASCGYIVDFCRVDAPADCFEYPPPWHLAPSHLCGIYSHLCGIYRHLCGIYAVYTHTYIYTHIHIHTHTYIFIYLYIHIFVTCISQCRDLIVSDISVRAPWLARSRASAPPNVLCMVHSSDAATWLFRSSSVRAPWLAQSKTSSAL